MLKNFVSEANYPVLVDLIRKVKNGTLKDEVSIVEIWGGPSSGKTTFIDVLRSLNTSARLSLRLVYNQGFDGILPNWAMAGFSESIVCSDEYDTQDETTMTTILRTFHLKLNSKSGLVYRDLHSSDTIAIENPAAIIVSSGSPHNISSQGKRKCISLHFPKTFKYARGVVEACLKECEEIV